MGLFGECYGGGLYIEEGEFDLIVLLRDHIANRVAESGLASSIRDLAVM